MKKPIVFVGILLFLAACKIQQKEVKIPDAAKPSKFDFVTQGEQEKNWTKQLFASQHKTQKFRRYIGEVNVVDSAHIQFGSSTLVLFNCNKKFTSVFISGIFYPAILNLETLRISDFDEISFLGSSAQIKRFRFLTWKYGFSNPTVYFIELTDNNADAKTSIVDFIKRAKLTFVKEGWTLI